MNGAQNLQSLDHRLRCAVALQAPFTKKKADRSEGQRDTTIALAILRGKQTVCLFVREPIRSDPEPLPAIESDSRRVNVSPTSDQFSALHAKNFDCIAQLEWESLGPNIVAVPSAASELLT
uniref:HDC02551 n=1 Tax=Drosophila melanogaster TaxID=7227 RepID=Q6IHH9_DROME|nr:TPA_inf: HDC02551 [Drosophila melanogaster]